MLVKFPRILSGERSPLYVYSNSRDVLDLVSSWGEPDTSPHLHADQCWALRRGRAYAYGISEIDFSCEHVGTEDHPYFCLPIIAHGDTIGLLHIAFPSLLAVRDKSDEIAKGLAPSFEMAQICAEQISLAAAKVRLQAELQDKSVKDALTGLCPMPRSSISEKRCRRAPSARTSRLSKKARTSSF
ncbi:MAG: GAF domain-containing protein [Rhodobacteraceae bacterium]|nr:GAF domain-containing protein [Paracoccaceae bacterium]